MIDLITILSLLTIILLIKITHKELAEDLENVLFDLTNGEVYEAIKYLGDIITTLKKNVNN